MPASKSIPAWIHILILVLILTSVSWAKKELIQSNKSQKPRYSSQIKTLLMGDSHTVKQFDPHYFEDAVNLGQSGEFVYYSYYKLKKMLGSGMHPRRVILSLSYHSLADFPFYADAEMNLRYHLLVDRRFYHQRFRYEWTGSSSLARYLGDEYGVPLALGQDLAERYQIHKGKLNWLGGYEPQNGSHIGNKSALKDALMRHYRFRGLKTGVSEAKKAYLKDFASLCRQRGIELWLVNTPVHPDYLKGVPKTQKAAVDSLANELARDGIKYLNLSRMPFADAEWYDYDHLNRAGAERFCKYLGAPPLGGFDLSLPVIRYP